MQQFDITVPANKPFVVNAPGRFIKYVSGSNGGGDATLLVTPGLAGGQVLALVPGQAYRVAANQPVPSSWTVANKAGGATILGNIVVGDGDFLDATVAGTVSVIDDSINRSLAGSSYIGKGYQTGTTGQYPAVQLWNPAGSGKNVILETSTIESGSAGQVVFGSNSASIGGTLQTTVSAKLVSKGVGVAQILTAAVASGNQGQIFGAITMTANGNINLPFRDPIVLPPGYGFFVAGAGASGVDLLAMFEWYEK